MRYDIVARTNSEDEEEEERGGAESSEVRLVFTYC